MKEQPGSSAVVQAVASDKYGIGYSGIGYMTADVRSVPLSAKQGGVAIATEPKFAYSGEYPLSRFLYLSVNHKPGGTIDPLRGEFIRRMSGRTAICPSPVRLRSGRCRASVSPVPDMIS